MEIKITNRQELNAAVANLRAHTIQMCNDTSKENFTNSFLAAKDYLLAIYKYNAIRFEEEQSE